MRIKKYQKIICLGLALLSIMVLPCSANDNNNSSSITILKSIYDENTNSYINSDLESEYVNEANYKLPNYLNLEYVITYFYDSGSQFLIISNKPQVVYVGFFREKLNYDLIMQILDITHDKQADFVYQTNNFIIDDIDVTINLFKFHVDEPYVVLDETYYSCRFSINSAHDIGLINQYMVFTRTDEAVLNITTYTNLLIQNFVKAFSFMTGPVLPWVLLGITVSLITFGIHTTKRFYK